MESLRAYFDAERGRRVALAAALNVSPSTLSMWKRVPAERVVAVSLFTGISRHELRPDLYPAEGVQ